VLLQKIALAACCTLFIALATSAQIPQVTEETQTPSPGTGHDYIQGLNETVNPSNGAVSLKINIPVPKGRQLTVPFYITYNSGQVLLGWANNFNNNIGYPNLSIGGWNYTVPAMSSYYGTYDDPNYGPCGYSTDYVFYDAAGNATTLSLAQTDDSNACSAGGYTDHTGAQNGTLISSVYGTVNDASGTVYGFNGFGAATQIEDRNGNIVTVDGNALTGQFSYADTMGRTILSSSGFGSGTTTITSSKFTAPYTVTWESASINYTVYFVTDTQNNYSCIPPSSQVVQGSATVIQSIALPNGQAYTFTYDGTYGKVSKITYPSGAYVRYVWGTRPATTPGSVSGVWDNGSNYNCAVWYTEPVVTDRYVSPDGVDETEHQTFSYNAYYPSLAATTTIADTDLITNQTRTTTYDYTNGASDFVPDNPNGYGSPIFNDSSVVAQSGSSTLRTVNKSWLGNDPRELATERTTLEDGSTAFETDYCYNLNYQVVEKDEFNYSGTGAQATTCNSTTATGPLLRKTATAYASFGYWSDYPCFCVTGQWIIDRPSSITTYDGSNNRAAETDYSYGNSTASVTAYSHDDGTYSSSSTLNRGNLLSYTRQCLQSCQNATTTFTYDDTGQVLTQVDPDSHPPTQYFYNDCFASGTGSPPGATDAYLTRIVDAMGHTENFCYGYSDGTLRSSTDQNSQTTNYAYSDSLDRLTQASYPDTGSTQYGYHDAAPMTTTITKAITSSTNLVQSITYDGFDREVQTELNSDPDGPTYTATQYDGIGRTYKVWNATRCSPPTSGCGESTWGFTTHLYDALDRPTTDTMQDGSVASNSYSLNCATVTDEAGKTRESCTDGLGRMTSVTENPGGLNYLTSYSYDALDNLTGVTQVGSRQRSFVYDSLSRLTSAANPESGTVGYTYDANGNVITKTDARGIVTCYGNWSGSSCGGSGYDNLNRVTQKSYSDGTPTSNFQYDATSDWGATLTNTVGRLTESWTSGTPFSASVYSYDSMGRTILHSQCTPYTCGRTGWGTTATYDLLGDMNTFTGAVGVTLTQTFNTAARPTQLSSSLVDSQHPATLASSLSYSPIGSFSQMTLGNGLLESRAYNNRLQATEIKSYYSGGFVRYDFIYSYTDPSGRNNGNLMSWNSTGSDFVFGRTYSYDPVNRLSTMNQSASNSTLCSGALSLSWNYDAWGNRTDQNLTSGNPCGTFHTTVGTNNRLGSPYQYDATGNMTYDGVHNYFYDAEDRLVQVDGSANYCSTQTGTAATACYAYDAMGNRTEKMVGSTGTEYAYDLSNRVSTEFQPGCSTGCWEASYNYFNGSLLAEYTNGTTYFAQNDHLGSTRLFTGVDGSGQQSWDYLPFGELIEGGFVTTHLFTGKERDSESNLDNFGARYDSSSIGRFMTPDWSATVEPVPYAKLDDPESLNLYAYVRNNPLTLTDPTGHCWSLLKHADVLCDWEERVDNAFHREGFHTNDQVALFHKADGYLRDMGVSTKGLGFAAVIKTYQTYTKFNPKTGETYSGKTSGTGTPAANVAKRSAANYPNKDYESAKLDQSSTNEDAIRGREQQLIKQNGGAQSEGGTSGNAINGVSPNNPNAGRYQKAAEDEFGRPVPTDDGGNPINPLGEAAGDEDFDLDIPF